jgi:transcriptional regulator with XRE-family HTH domain
MVKVAMNMDEKIDNIEKLDEKDTQSASINPTLQKKLDSLTVEEKEQIAASLKILGETFSKTRIELPKIELPEEFFERVSSINEGLKQIIRNTSQVIAALNLSSLVENITAPKRGSGYYKGLEIEKYRKIRKIKAKDLSDALGIDKSTLSKYSSGTIDVPASKVIEISELLNVSLDLLLKRKDRELNLGYIGKEIYLYDFDYKKKAYVPTSTTYALDKNLEPLKDKNLIVIRYKKPIYELGLPKNTVLFITEGSEAIALGSTKKVAVCIQEKIGDNVIEYFSYVEPLRNPTSDKDYSSVINYTYVRDGETFTTRLSTLQKMVKFVIHKAVIDF